MISKKKNPHKEFEQFYDTSYEIIAKQLRAQKSKPQKFLDEYDFEADIKKVSSVSEGSASKHRAWLAAELSIISQEKDAVRIRILIAILAFLDTELSMKSIKIPTDFNKFDPLAFMKEMYERLQTEFL